MIEENDEKNISAKQAKKSQ